MALKVRAAQTRMAAGEGADPTIFVNVECFDDVANQVIAETVLQYSLAGMVGMTSAQKQARVRDDAVAWGGTVKANATSAAPILTLVGAAVALP